MYTNNFAILGARTTGPSGGRFLIVGPNEAAPSTAIRSPTPTAFLLSRTLFRNHADLEAARRFQAGILLRPRGPAAPVAPTVSPDAPWEAYFAAAGELLLENPPPATDQAFFERAAVLGLSPAGFRPRALTAAQRAQVERGVAEARAIARDPMGGMEVRGSWGYPQANLGWFDQDYVFRGQTAMVGLFALTPSEVIYTRSVGDTGRGTFHAPAYRIRFPPGGEPPVDGFWSLTLYEVAPDGRLLFTPNPMDRYSIGDRTPGLLRDRDGALELLIARKDPGQGGRTNWLPAPAERPFVLSFRCYWPRPAFRNGSYRLPEVTRA